MSPPVIPDHVLLRPIGRGAYGEVWLARNVMGTPRAVKIIWRRQFESARPFEREFAGIKRYEPVSRSSGGLVHVLQVGRNDIEEYFYYVMELADNAEGMPAGNVAVPQQSTNPGIQESDAYKPRSLRSDLRRVGCLSTSECLRLAIEVASGLAQLHRHGLIHRDVKPGNIIYVNGRAKLADIGLVTVEGEGRTFVGTEGYIPPEGPGSPSADLYALGIALYEASTGFEPERLPDVPAEWFSSPAGDQALELHEIILKACEGQRERRYPNADAMQADLALLQSGESVRHTRALQRRYARLRMSGLVGTCLLVLALATALFSSYRARLAAESREKEALLRQQAQQAQAEAQSAEHEARHQLQAALYEEARALVMSKELGHRTRALEAIRQAAGSTNSAELRRVAFAALGLPDLRLEREITLPGTLELAELDPKLERIALAGPSLSVTIYSLPDLQVLATLAPSTPNQSYVGRWSADGRFLALKRTSGGSRGDVEVWNVGRTQLVFTAQGDLSYDAFAFHPRAPRLVIGHTTGNLNTLDLETGAEQIVRLPGAPSTITYSPSGDRFAASYLHGTNWVVAVHAVTGEALGATDCPEPVFLIAWHPGGQLIAVLGRQISEWGRGVWLINLKTRTLTLLGRHKIKASGAVFSPDGNYLVSCGWDRELLCWDLRTQQRVFTFSDSGYRFHWSTDGLRCATIPKGNRLKLFRFEPPLFRELSGNRGERLGPGGFSPNRQFLAVPDNLNLCVWDLNCASLPSLLTPSGPFALPFFATNNSSLFAASGRDGDPHLDAWQIAPPETARERPKAKPLPISVPAPLLWAGLSANDLILTTQDGVTFIPQSNLTNTDCRVVKIPPGQGTVSPDGRWLAVTYSYSPEINIYSLATVQEVAHLLTSGQVAAVWFSPASDELAVINRAGLEQWDTATWQLKRRQPGAPVSGSYVLYTPDGNGIWRVTSFHDTALLDRRTLEPLLPLPANVLPLAVSHDGGRLAVSVDDQRVQIWDMAELRNQFRALALDWTSK
jgi:WD40 repeat protein